LRSPINSVTQSVTARFAWVLALAITLNVLLNSPAIAKQAESDKQDSDQVTVDIVPDFVYGHKDGMALTYDVVKPKTPNGCGVCFMVSGGWNSRWFPPKLAINDSLFDSLLKSGYTVFFVRHGSAPKYKVPEAVNDVRSAIQNIRKNAKEFGVDPEKLGVCGASAGGHLSTMLGMTGRKSQRVAAVVAYFPPTDLRDYVSSPNSIRDFPALDFDKELADDVSPELQASQDDAPTLLIHGDQDRLVPLKHSQRLKEKLDEQKVPCDLIVIEGASHGFQGKDKTRAEKALIDWFDKYLRN